ncbi:unnamed protein product [Durusdinium trenchii]|uniref:CNNM transmembrane domain-containing protein n=1 Tax=Durusdinium trenchii TaxID=1381693 RepID=A0ABP0J5U2_9DINO
MIILFGLLASASAQGHIWSAKLCPELYDANGIWKGSLMVGGNYTLYCAPGFEVSGQPGGSSRSMTCPDSLMWPSELYCKNIDDCAKLKHGCGALGLCLDLIESYDCNCENGFFQRHMLDGEIVCGPEGIDEQICRGYTCGAYGVCIDLVGNGTGYESVKARSLDEGTFRCECRDGFFDNGTSCEHQDCGAKTDALGEWQGNTKFGGEYTLRCPLGSFVSSGALREITISCPANGQWLETNLLCVSPSDEETKSRMATMEIWFDMSAVLLCVLSAALAAGLTLGLATLEPFGLQVILAARPEDCVTQEERSKLKLEQQCASRILPLVKDHHLLLVTLLLFNTVANEALPVFLDELVPSWVALLLSVSVVLVCGEILPSAVFTGPNQFTIASALVPLVSFLELVFYCVARPIANVLDQIFKDEVHEDGQKYSRAELRALLALHAPEERKQESEETPATIPAPPNSYSCDLLPKEPTEMSEEHSKDPNSSSVITTAELRMMDSVFGLQKQTLGKSRCFTVLKFCRIVNGQETCLDVAGRCALGGVDRCVLVLHTGSMAHVRHVEEDSDTDVSPMSPKLHLRISAVAGCLQLQELLKGGQQKLIELCSDPVSLEEDDTLLDAVRKLRSSGQSSAVVVRPISLDRSSAVVRGVVHISQILSNLLSGEESLEKDVVAEQLMCSPSVSPGFRQPAVVSTQLRHPFVRMRSNLGETAATASAQPNLARLLRPESEQPGS